MTRTALRICNLCEATCGLQLELDDDVITAVRGDDDHVFSQGYLCPKGAAFGDLDHDPDRLHEPMVRVDGRLQTATWDEAFAHIAERLAPILDEHGRDCVALYLGNPNVHNLSGQLYNRVLIKATGSKTVTSASTVDQMPKHRSSGELFGDPLAIPVPDIDRTDHLLVLGANPLMSNGSLMTAPDMPGRIKELRARGGRLVIVDPRRSRTAAVADEHLAIRPGTDALFLAALGATLVEEDLVALGRLGPLVSGLDDVVAELRTFTAESVASVVGIDAMTIRRQARDLAAADRAVVYGRIGTHTTSFGTLAAWLVDILNILTGNLDRPGGAMFPLAAHEDRGGRSPQRFGRFVSRVSGHPEVLGELPASALAEEITTPGEGRIRVLVAVAGNPVLSTPDGSAVDDALGQLDLFVAVDPYLTATTRRADVILPPPPSRFRGHADLAFAALSIRNVFTYSPAVVALPEGQPDEWELLLRLAAIFQGQDPGDDVAGIDDFVAYGLASQLVARPTARTRNLTADELVTAVSTRRGPERLLDLLLRSGPYGDGFDPSTEGLSLDVAIAAPHGIDFGPLQERLPMACNTKSGLVEMASPAMIGDIGRLRDQAPTLVPEGLLLVGRRHLRSNNSWMHNLNRLDGRRDLCTLQLHPDDAAARGVVEGDRVTVTSDVGHVTAPVEITEDIRLGVVSLPHGFGHSLDGIEQNIAHPGVNVNLLTSRRGLDPLSGNAVLNAVPVDVVRAS